jgi:hypothetical protein
MHCLSRILGMAALVVFTVNPLLADSDGYFCVMPSYLPRREVYRALLDERAVATWMVPDGMTSHVHAFEAREGGLFRISPLAPAAETIHERALTGENQDKPGSTGADARQAGAGLGEQGEPLKCWGEGPIDQGKGRKNQGRGGP